MTKFHKNVNRQGSILMIAYWFPPIKSVTLRSYYMYREWKKYFKNVTVLTTSNRKKMPNEEVDLDEDDIHSIPTLDYRTISAALPSPKTHYSQTEKKKPLIGFIARLLDSFPFNFLIGEGGIFYILFGYWKAVQLIKNNRPTYIYSTFRPYSDHLIAYLLKRKYPDLYWIADFRDLHVDHLYKDLYFVKFQRWCNRKIINRANLITTVSEGLAEQLEKYKPPVYVLRNGYSELFAKKAQQNKDFFQIAYTGSIYTPRQTPELLLKVLAQLIKTGKIDAAKIRFVYAGKDGQFWQQWMEKYQLSSIFIDKSVLSRQNSIQLQQESHLNVLLSYTAPEVKGIMTGKMYEYFNADNATLAIVEGGRDEEFETIFEDLNPGLMVYNVAYYEAELADYLINLYHEWMTYGCVLSEIDQEKLRGFQWKNTIPKFLNYLEESCSNKDIYSVRKATSSNRAESKILL